MPTDHASKVLQQVRRVVLGHGADFPDKHLLSCFIERRDEDAFAALVKRHGPMVWGVCRRVLGSHQDAEDAFQATFLVLVRKAASIVPREMLGNWLYGVAFQTAVRVRSMNTKRRARERQMEKMPEPAAAEQDLWSDLRPLLDQELSRLPDKYRAAVVLCDLEGKTYQQAARQIGCPAGTLAARLSRARAMLAKRLARHGLVVSGGALAAVLSQNVASAGMPTAVVSSTIKAASIFAAGQAATTGVISVKVAALTEGALKSMLLTKLKTVVVLSVVAALCSAGGVIYRTQAADQPNENKKGDGFAPKKDAAKSDKTQIQGTWVRVAVESDTENRAETEDVTWTFKKDTFQTCWKRKDAAPVVHKGSYTLNPKGTPPEIDFTFLSQTDPNLKGPWKGIYELKGDTLRICYDDASNMRPREIKTFPPDVNRDCTIFTFQRVKQEQKKREDGSPKGDKIEKSSVAPAPTEKQAATIDGLVGGKKVQPDAKSVEAGADAAAQLLAASNLTDFLNPGQPIDKGVWREQVVIGIENKRPHLRIRFAKPRQIEGNLNGVKAKYRVSEVVFFEPSENGPICLWGRDGDRYYFANQIVGHETLVKWLREAQKR